MQVGIGDDVRVVALLAQAILHPAGLVRVLAHLVQDLAGQLPEIADRVRHGHLFLGLGTAPGIDRVRNGIAAQQIHVFFRDTQEMQRHRKRDFPKQLVDQVGAAVVDETIDILARQAAHHWFMVFQRFGRERFHQHAPPRHVGRLVFVAQRAVHRIAVRRQHGVGFRACRGDFLKRDRRAERDVVPEDRLDVKTGSCSRAHRTYSGGSCW
ncbi:hypothetical protein G6F31_017868 [Rhizopus arrhizus]|nr:hypothetical protein G6F31_017868 [Rhizopus arrhizus]